MVSCSHAPNCLGRLSRALALVCCIALAASLVWTCPTAAFAQGDGPAAPDVAATPAEGQAAPDGQSPQYAPEAKKRYINVVYDDSGSMETEGNIAWCEAHYAIEVFAAMLDAGDELRVFTMSDSEDFAGHEASTEPALVIDGSLPSQERAKLAHQDFSKARTAIGTPFAAADNAYADLESRSAEAERCLVILTDGAFESIDSLNVADANALKDKVQRKAKKAETRAQIADVVQQRLATWASKDDMRIRYLVLGDGQPVGFDALKAIAQSMGSLNVRSTADEPGGIMKGIVDECTQIFGMDEATEKYHVDSGKFDIDIPMKRVIVFAQGKDADVQKLEAFSAGAAVSLAAVEGVQSVDVAQVSHVDKPHATLLANSKGEVWTPARVASRMGEVARLQGEVATFNAEDGFDMRPGSLDIAGSEDVTIYYEPYVDVELTMRDTKLFGKTSTVLVHSNGDIDMSGAPLCDGRYQTTYRLLTKDGEDVTSKFEDIHNMRDCSLRFDEESGGAFIEDLCNGTQELAVGHGLLSVDMGVGKKASIAGSAQVDVVHRSLFSRLWLPVLLLVIFALVAAFIIMELRKPRFPKLKPAITLDDGEDYRLSYKAQVENRIWPPWAPEKTFFTVKIKGDTGDSHDLRKRFQLAGKRIDLVAAKKKNGRRQLRLSDATIGMMEKHEANDTFPDPDYSTLNCSFGKGGSFSFDGNVRHKRRGWINGTNYTIRFS